MASVCRCPCRRLALLALLRAAAPVAAGEAPDGAGTGEAPGAGARHFTVSSPPPSGRFLAAAQASQKYHPVAVGDHECENVMESVESIEDCAAAASILWPSGFMAPCTYPVWADNILITNEPDQPYGCLALQNNGNGCGLRWNPAGKKHDCRYPQLTCTVVCWEPDEIPEDANTTANATADRP